MFSSLFRLLSTQEMTNTNSMLTNEILTSTTNSDAFINFISYHLANSSNGFARIFYHFIKDNPYAIFTSIIIGVLFITLILRFSIFILTNKQKKSKRQVFRRIWNLFISRNFLWIGFLIGVILATDYLIASNVSRYIIKTSFLSILLWIMYTLSQRIFDLYIRALLIFRTTNNRIQFFKNKNILIVFSRSIRITWFLVFITIFLGLWSVQLGPILAGLGIAGIVVGLALQDTLSHIVGGVSLMLDETYSEGDYVLLENGQDGVIFQIGYRSTKLRTFDDEIIIIPNGILSKMLITNLSQPVKRVRVTTYYKTLAIDASPDIVKKLLLQAVSSIPQILRYPEPYVFFLEPIGNLYRFRLNFFVASYGIKLSTTDHVQQEIVRLFAENNIRFGVEESYIHINNKNQSLLTNPDNEEKI